MAQLAQFVLICVHSVYGLTRTHGCSFHSFFSHTRTDLCDLIFLYVLSLLSNSILFEPQWTSSWAKDSYSLKIWSDSTFFLNCQICDRILFKKTAHDNIKFFKLQPRIWDDQQNNINQSWPRYDIVCFLCKRSALICIVLLVIYW